MKKTNRFRHDSEMEFIIIIAEKLDNNNNKLIWLFFLLLQWGKNVKKNKNKQTNIVNIDHETTKIYSFQRLLIMSMIIIMMAKFKKKYKKKQDFLIYDFVLSYRSYNDDHDDDGYSHRPAYLIFLWNRYFIILILQVANDLCDNNNKYKWNNNGKKRCLPLFKCIFFLHTCMFVCVCDWSP